MKKLPILGVVVLAMVIGGVVIVNQWWTPKAASDAQKSHRSSAGRGAFRTASDAVRAMMRDMPQPKHGSPYNPPVDIFENLSGNDKKLAEAVQKALEDDDCAATISAATKAFSSTNASVRLAAVEALAWFGPSALPELTGAMADSDEDVANAAENAWESALSDIDDAQQRFKIAAATMGVIHNSDHLTTISGQLSSAALEMIDGESDEAKANDVRFEVVQTLVGIMESGNEQNVEVAKEAYEDITGFEWLGIDEAERYLEAPESYEPSSDDESVQTAEKTLDNA